MLCLFVFGRSPSQLVGEQVMEPGNTRERFDATVEGAVTAAVAGEFN